MALSVSGEGELLARARAGDPVAFGALVKPHLSTLRRFARAFVRSQADGDDLAQEALLKAFRSIQGFEGRSQLLTWLYTVTRSVALDAQKSRAGQERRKSELLDEEAHAGGQDPERLVSARSEASALWACLRELPAEFRIPIVLADVEGRSYDDIALIEGVPVGTIRSRLSRGRAELREALARREGFFQGPGRSEGTPGGSPSSHEEENP